MSKDNKASGFQLRGRFLGFVAPGAKLIRLDTAAGEFEVKLSKELRPSLDRTLALDDWLEVSGHQKRDGGRLKAERVLRLAQPHPAEMAAPLASAQPIAAAQASSRRKTEILVCQKSDCCKLGANALMRELQAELDQRGLPDIKLRGTGCMKRCKAGPNLIMPDRSRYSRIQAGEVAALLDPAFFRGTGAG